MANKISSRKLCYDFLKINKEEMLSLAAGAEIYYTRREIPKSNGKVRIIEPSHDYLKRLQKKINREILQPAIENLPSGIMGARKGFSIRNNAKLHAESRATMKYDIKDFFPSISRKQVFHIFFDELDFCEEASNILSLLTTFENHVPQGAPTSSSLAILAIKKMCLKLDEFCRKKNLRWSIWVDDIFVSGDENDLRENKWKIDKIVASMPFQISEEKRTGILKKSSRKIDFTGICLDDNFNLSLGHKKLYSLKKRVFRAKNLSEKLAGKFRYAKIVKPKYFRNVKTK